MARIAKNQLTLRAETDGTFFLFGYVDGKKIRKRHPKFEVLAQLKQNLESAVAARIAAEMAKEKVVATWLSAEQLRDAEAAFRALGAKPRTLLECVIASDSVLGDAMPVKITSDDPKNPGALEQWIADLTRRRRQPRTINDNRNLVLAFADTIKGTSQTVGEITPQQIQKWVFADKLSAQTQCNRAVRLRTFLTFCQKKKMLRASPFDLDTTDLAEVAKSGKEPIRILTADQCADLLKAALVHDQRYVPYVILSIWCFMRPSEVCRTVTENVRINGKTTIQVWPRKRRTVRYREAVVPANMAGLLKSCIDTGLWPKGQPVFFSSSSWDTLREKAGLLQRGKADAKGWRPIIHSVWQEDIMRHTGISYLYNKLISDGVRDKDAIEEVTDQAGNSEDVCDGHYLSLPADGDTAKFYGITGEIQVAHQLAG